METSLIVRKPRKTANLAGKPAFILAVWAAFGIGFGQTAITGTFQHPDGTNVTGQVSVQLTLPTVTNSCTSPVQVSTLRPIYVAITGGTLGTLSLYPSTCLSVVKPTPGVPFISTGAAAGIGALVSVSGNNVSGSFTLTTGTSPKPGIDIVGQVRSPMSTLVTMILKTVNGNQPFCITGPVTSNATFSGAVSTFQIGQKTTTMTLTAGNTALTASTVYTWNYSCVQPYKVAVKDSTGRQLYSGFWSVPNTGSADVTVLDRQ